MNRWDVSNRQEVNVITGRFGFFMDSVCNIKKCKITFRLESCWLSGLMFKNSIFSVNIPRKSLESSFTFRWCLRLELNFFLFLRKSCQTNMWPTLWLVLTPLIYSTIFWNECSLIILILNLQLKLLSMELIVNTRRSGSHLLGHLGVVSRFPTCVKMHTDAMSLCILALMGMWGSEVSMCSGSGWRWMHVTWSEATAEEQPRQRN